jgi:hypothetical protein
MAAYVKFNSFVEAMAEKVHNLGADTITVALSNSAPNASTYTQLSQVTQISYTNCSSRVVTVASSSQTAGTYSLVVNDLVLTASGTVGPFQYVIVYNDTATNDELICYFDHGSAVTLATGETYTIDFGATLFTLA